jgi:hypothetical protein
MGISYTPVLILMALIIAVANAIDQPNGVICLFSTIFYLSAKLQPYS